MDEFCQFKLFRRPPTKFFTPPPYVRCSEGIQIYQNPSLKLKSNDPSRLLLLTASLKSNNSKELEQKINDYFRKELKCQASFIANLKLSLPNEAVIRKINNLDLNFTVSMEDELLTQVLKQRHGLHLSLNELWSNLLEKINKILPELNGNVLAIPIYQEESENSTFIVFIIGANHQSRVFTSTLVEEVFRFIFAILFNSIKSEESERLKKQAKNLLETAENFNCKMNCLEVLLPDILKSLKDLTESEWGCIYLWKKEEQLLVPVVYDKTYVKMENLPKNIKIPGYVFSTGKKLIIKNAYDHKLFLKTDDIKYGMKTRNIFCSSIYDFGVIYLCNKIDDKDYNFYDEENMAAIIPSCSLAINHALIMKGLKSELFRSKILQRQKFEVREAEIKHFMQAKVPSIKDFYESSFNPRDIPLHQINIFILKIFRDFKLIQTFKFETETLLNFVLQLQTSYQKRSFHDWTHAFTTLHFVAFVLRNFNVENKILSDLEVLALFVACLGYDVATNGMCNAYKLSVDGKLVFKASIVEKFNQQKTFNILTNDSCNFLSKLDDSSYCRCLMLIKNNILATSLENQMKILRKQEILLQKDFKPNSEAKFLFSSLLISCGQFSDQIKSWRHSRNICSLLYEEYFLNNNKVVDEQIIFLKTTCLPLFTVLSTIFSDLQFSVDVIAGNIRRWEYLRNIFMEQELLTECIFENDFMSIADSLMDEEVEEEEEDDSLYGI